MSAGRSEVDPIRVASIYGPQIGTERVMMPGVHAHQHVGGGLGQQISQGLGPHLLGVVVYFRGREHAERPWNTLIAPALRFAGLLVVLVIVSKNFTLLIGGSTVLAVTFQPVTFGLGVLLGVLGIVLAVRWSRTRPSTYARIGGGQSQRPPGQLLIPIFERSRAVRHS